MSAKGAEARRRPTHGAPAPERRRGETDTATPLPLPARRSCACGGHCPACSDGERVQPRLENGPSDDPLEQEAERTAERVLAAPKQAPPPALTPTTTAAPVPAPLTEEEPEPEETLEAELPGPLPAPPDDPEPGGAGQPLPTPLRHFFEPRFGRSFAAVVIHTGAAAERATAERNALAFTYGNQLWLGRGQRPEVGRLLAHELTHVVQQGYAPPLSGSGGEAAVGPRIQRTPGAGVESVEVDCGRREIIFYQGGTPFRYRLTRCEGTLEAREYEAEVRSSTHQLYFVGGGFRFELDNDRHDGDPFDLFSEGQSTITVTVWTGTAAAEPEGGEPEPPAEAGGAESEGGGGSGGDPASGGGTPPPEPRRGGVRISPGASEADREFVRQTLLLIHGGNRDAEAPTLDTYISMADIDALRRLVAHPDREALIEALRGSQPSGEPPQEIDYANLIDSLIAQRELAHYGDLFDFSFSTSEEGSRPLVNRPVHGHIAPLTADLVPRKEGLFEFMLEDSVDRFAVPHVFIRWYAARRNPEGEAGSAQVVERETVNYIEIDLDSLLNDRRFEVTFDESGEYEIHAFVHHSFFQPAHFTLTVSVFTEEERLQQMEAAAEAFGMVESTETGYHFSDVAIENTAVSTTIATMVGGTALAIPLLFMEDSDALGIRREGELDPARLDPRAALAYVEQQREQIRALRDRYSGSGEEDLQRWAEDRLAQLDSLHQRLSSNRLLVDNRPVAVSGRYVSRRSGVRSGELRLSSWFTYDSDSGEYEATLVDYTQLVRNRDFTFEASGDSYEQVYERLFFLLSSTYPNGRMRFGFQIYRGTTAQSRFVQFERVTDTLLNDVQEIAFSQPVSIVVNVASAVLTVFPPTAPVGIAVGLLYNGADTALNFMDAARSGTVSSANYVDIGLLAVDIIPLAGRAVRLGETSLRVLRVGGELTELAGNLYVFNAQAWEQVEELRTGDMTELARLQTEVNTLIAHNAPPAEIVRKQQEMGELQARVRRRATEVFLEMAATQGLQILSQRGAAHLAEHYGRQHGLIPPEGAEAAPRPEAEEDAETRALMEEGGGEHARPDLEEGALRRRPAEESAHVRLGESDPDLALGLPERLRGEVPVIRTEGQHRSVRVRAEYGLFGVKRIWIEAGSLADAGLVGRHVAAVELFRRYQGLTGSIRSALEYAGGMLQGLPPDAVRRARELRGEIEKLPDIIRDHGAELEARRDALTDEEIAGYEERIHDLEGQLEEHRQALLDLNPESRSEGYVAALDRVFEGMRRDISAQTEPQQRAGARERQSMAEQLLARFMRRAEGEVEAGATPSDSDVTRIRGLVRDMVFDPLFGRLALEDLQRRTRTVPGEGEVLRRRRTRISMDQFLAPLIGHLETVDAERRARHESADAAEQAIGAYRARPDVPDADVERSGTVAAGVLEVVGEDGSSRRVGEVMLGASARAATTEVPVDPRYRRRTTAGETMTDPQFVDHAEQTVLGRSARALEVEFPDADQRQIQGELRIHVEQEPCFNCLAGLPGQPAGAGPFHQFTTEFPGVRVVVTYPDADHPSGPPRRLVIQNGTIIDE